MVLLQVGVAISKNPLYGLLQLVIKQGIHYNEVNPGKIGFPISFSSKVLSYSASTTIRPSVSLNAITITDSNYGPGAKSPGYAVIFGI